MSQIRIVIECCDGEETRPNKCLRERCPRYMSAKNEVERAWPFVGTGFGNLYGNPTHERILGTVRENMKKEDCARAKRLHNTIGHGNDLTPESGDWLTDHLSNCQSCGKSYELRES